MLDGLTTGLPVALDWPNRRTQSVMTAKAKWKIYEEVAHYLLETQAKALGLGLERVTLAPFVTRGVRRTVKGIANGQRRLGRVIGRQSAAVQPAVQ